MSHRAIRRRPLVDDGHLPADLHPVLKRVYATRQIRDPQELDHGLNGLLPPDTLTGINAGAQLLADHIQRGSRILIVGDFDADGATSTVVGIRALRAMGAMQVDYLVPNRFEYGYGLTPEIVALAADYKPALLITVDNGISSIAGVAAARKAGIDVLITDHHLPGAELPNANVIVNPNVPGDGFPSKALAGVGVIFYLMLALRKYLRDNGTTQDLPNLAELLDLVALGTVADVVPLDHNNRILVAQGLARIRAGRCRPGILALLQTAKRVRERIGASDLGFALGPRLNAAGRLADMAQGIECLLTDDISRAQQLAAELDTLNRERRDIETQMQAQALKILAAMHLDEGSLPVGVCLFEPDWHQGVVGLVAGRVKERIHRPVIAFADAGDGEYLKGSARSVPGLHIRDALDAIAATHPDLINKFGGHAMAAGLSIRQTDFDAFSNAFDTEVKRWLGPDDLTGTIISDGELAMEDISLECAQQLADGGPWGQAFPEPVFDGMFGVISARIVGEKHLKLKLMLSDKTRPIEAILFNHDAPAPDCQQVRIAYRLSLNEYRDTITPQLIVTYLEPA
ncbi:MAG TPA: single-stranded-DNA-specific exonuclease RecJ [Gammaproteobacteria bacterium]|nr:single-stranded-DNA-specific exonuclease RecJ [Gammaproteobacteria bacterium]